MLVAVRTERNIPPRVAYCTLLHRTDQGHPLAPASAPPEPPPPGALAREASLPFRFRRLLKYSIRPALVLYTLSGLLFVMKFMSVIVDTPWTTHGHYGHP